MREFKPYPKKGMPPKKEKKALKRTPIKKKFKVTGEMELFEEIAEERPWDCFVTGEQLFELTPTQFMHVLPKALNKYPKMKLYKDNIVLASNDTHYKWDHTPRSQLIGDGWDRLRKLEAELKARYKEL